MVFFRNKCTKETIGTIVEIQYNKKQKPVRVVVEFVTEYGTTGYGNGLEIKERIRYHRKSMKVSGYSVGYFRVPKIEDLKINAGVHVRYCPSHPSTAYIVENSFGG